MSPKDNKQNRETGIEDQQNCKSEEKNKTVF